MGNTRFSQGDKIVAIRDSSEGMYKSGDTATVFRVVWYPGTVRSVRCLEVSMDGDRITVFSKNWRRAAR